MNIKAPHFRSFSGVVLFLLSGFVHAQTPQVEEQTVTLGQNYQLKVSGALRFAEGTHGSSRLAYTVGPIAVTRDETLIYTAGHAHHFSIGAFALDKSPSFGDIDDLPIISSALPFIKIAPPHSKASATRIVGVDTLDAQLLITTDEYYDADANNSEHLVVFPDRHDLSISEQVGFFTLQGASHAAGWMSSIPSPLSADLNAIYLSGSANNIPINSRHSIGPTFFTWFPFYLDKVDPAVRTISTEPLIDYSLTNPLHQDRQNNSLKNNLWTELSTAVYGFVSPNQKHYIIVGSSGGHESGIGYKITQDDGSKCAGSCAYEHDDYYNYFWIYDMKDIVKSHKGELRAHELRPTSYGRLDLFDHRYLIIGADFNRETNKLYLLIDELDDTQNKFEKQPALLVTEFIVN